MTTRLLPDSLTLVRNYLAARPSVQTFVSDRVHQGLPRNPGKPPFINVRRVGGIPDWYGDDRARLDIHCYGRTQAEASLMARTAFKELMEITEVDAIHTEGVVVDVRSASDLQELRDPTYQGPNQPHRFIFSITARIHT